MRRGLIVGMAAMIGCAGGQREPEPPNESAAPIPEIEVAEPEPQRAEAAPEEGGAGGEGSAELRQAEALGVLKRCDEEKSDCSSIFRAIIGEESDEVFGIGGIGVETGGGSSRPKSLRIGGQEPRIRSGPAAVTGNLPEEVIRRIVRQNQPKIRYCFEKQLATDPKLEGKLVVSFVIDAEGGVANAKESSSTLGNAALSSCVVGVFRTIQFPKPKGGSVTVNYPLVFRLPEPKPDDAAGGGKP